MIQSVGTPTKERAGSKAVRGSEARAASAIDAASGKSLSFEEARRQLETLSNNELLGNLQKINQKERRLKVLVLLYLSEIDRRQLYLPMGYSSLFDFCTMHLGYTRATAARRIRAARTAARYPEALEMLRSCGITITTLAMIGDILTPGNHRELLSEIRHKSTRQVEMLVSRHRPVPAIPDTVRPVCVARRVEVSPKERGGDSSAGINGQNLSSTEDTGSRKCNKISSSAETNSEIQGGRVLNARSVSGDDACSSAETTIILEQRFKIGFTVTPEFLKKYNKIKSLLSNAHPEGIPFEMLFDILMTEYLERHDPEKRRERRIERAAQQTPEKRPDREVRRADSPATQLPETRHRRTKQPENNIVTPGQEARPRNDQIPARGSRHIPAATRDIVYARDKGGCSFIGANGRRCKSTWDLEIDHIVPFAQGGDNSPGNLRLLCRKHNMHQATRAFGGEFMKNRITR